MVCDEEEEEAEDAEAEDAGEEAGSTDLKTRTPHHVWGKHVFFFPISKSMKFPYITEVKYCPKLDFEADP